MARSLVSLRNRIFGTGLLVASLGVVAAGCGDVHPDDGTVTQHAALTGSLTLSGTISTTAGAAVAGVKVTLNGGAQASTLTDATGHYSFSVNPGSYSVSASGVCTTFEPNVVNLTLSASNTAVNFFGSGGACGPQLFSGGLSGSLTLSGRVTSGGSPVSGVKVTLAGGTTGFRITDETGSYSFSVNPGSYSLKPSGACASFTPDVVNLNGLTASRVQNFTGTNCR
jgi:hypothetical protein